MLMDIPDVILYIKEGGGGNHYFSCESLNAR